MRDRRVELARVAANAALDQAAGIPDYTPAFTEWNQVSTVGYMITIAGVAVFFVNLFWSLAAGKKAPDNPWGEGATTLEWTLPSPPPFHQFATLPKID